MRYAIVTAALVLSACGSAPEKKAVAPPAPPPVKDDTSVLLAANRIAARVVPNHLLGKDALPGGSVGDYEEHGAKYQLSLKHRRRRTQLFCCSI
jgi:hypothetical protein